MQCSYNFCSSKKVKLDLSKFRKQTNVHHVGTANVSMIAGKRHGIVWAIFCVQIEFCRTTFDFFKGVERTIYITVVDRYIYTGFQDHLRFRNVQDLFMKRQLSVPYTIQKRILCIVVQ